MKIASRTLFLIGVAAAVGALVLLDRRTVDQSEAPAGAHLGVSTDDPRPSAPQIKSRPRVATALRDPFSPPPPPAPPPAPEVRVEVVAPPPPPTAPPLPFRYFGRMKGPSGKSADFVEGDSQLVAVAVGEVINDIYRIERVDETEIVIIHLPTKQRQSLPVTPQ